MIFGQENDLESTFTWLPKPLKMAVQHLKTTDSLAKVRVSLLSESAAR